MILFLKTHIDGYTRKDGTVVAAHEDKRVAAKHEAPAAKPHVTDTPEFKKWFGRSKVVDEDGRPLVVYHGRDGGLYQDAAIGEKSRQIRKQAYAIENQLRDKYGKDENGSYRTELWKQDPQYKDMESLYREAVAVAGDSYFSDSDLSGSNFEVKRSGDVGIHFTPDPAVASGFAEKRGAVFPVYLRAENLIRVPDVFSRYQGLEQALKEFEQAEVISEEEARDFLPDAIALDRKIFEDERDWGASKDVKAFWRRINSILSKKKGLALVYENAVEGGGDSYVVFNPKQIKSATGNSGGFDQKSTDMRKAVSTPLVLFFKSHVGAYLRGGKMVNLAGYQGRNARAVAMPGQMSLFGGPESGKPLPPSLLVGKDAVAHTPDLFADPKHTEPADTPIKAGADLPDSSTFRDAKGKQYRVHYMRGDLIVSHPIVNGKAQVSADTTVRFRLSDDIDPTSTERPGPLYLEKMPDGFDMRDGKAVRSTKADDTKEKPVVFLSKLNENESNLSNNEPVANKQELKMKDGQISYTFPDAAAIPAPLRGKTFTGGKLTRQMIGGAPVELVMFAERINGQSVAAKVAGKPELEAAVAAIKSAEAKEKADAQQALETAVPGLSKYEVAMRAYSNAQAAYDRASGRGYPAKEAAAAKAADDALQAVMAEYPATAMWRKIEAFTQARNDRKASAGDAAKKAVMAGTPIADAVAKMEADWSNAALQSAMNS